MTLLLRGCIFFGCIFFGPGSAMAQELRCEGLESMDYLHAEAVLGSLHLGPAQGELRTGSPYPADGADRLPVVDAWWPGRGRVQTVCAVHLEGDGYRLKTYGFPDTAVESGALITHRQHCGTCSSLQDLAVYVSKPDLTEPARACAREASLDAAADCMEAIGFTRPCAETWAYNAQHTRQACARICRKYYGLIPLLRGKMDSPNNLADGSLNPCLACDEAHSGPGFQYAAGRTRRGSGLQSAIVRSEEEVYKVDHTTLPGCHITSRP